MGYKNIIRTPSARKQLSKTSKTSVARSGYFQILVLGPLYKWTVIANSVRKM